MKDEDVSKIIKEVKEGLPITEEDVRRIVREELAYYATVEYVSDCFRSYDRSWD